MKTRKARGQVRRFFRRGIACLLALTGVAMAAVNAGVPLDWLGNLAAIPTASAAQETPSSDEPVPLLQRLLLGDSALLAQWASGAGDTAPQAHPEEGEAEAELQQVSPDQIQEKTISGGGTGYVNAQGISLFNRTSKTVDLEAVAQSGSSLTFQPAEAGPQVLIVHTHATEAYAQDSQNPYAETGVARTTDTNYNIIRVGDEIARIFQEMGIAVIHDKTLHDSPSYNDAYDNARTGIEGYLEQYPTIQMVLDIHRDALVDSDGTVYKPVLQIDGVKTAQVMLLVGTDDAGATFPDWTEHLALAMEIQQEMNSLWPGLARPMGAFRFPRPPAGSGPITKPPPLVWKPREGGSGEGIFLRHVLSRIPPSVRAVLPGRADVSAPQGRWPFPTGAGPGDGHPASGAAGSPSPSGGVPSSAGSSAGSSGWAGSSGRAGVSGVSGVAGTSGSAGSSAGVSSSGSSSSTGVRAGALFSPGR